jgi:tetratricopeptide (TPR) repeat protein
MKIQIIGILLLLSSSVFGKYEKAKELYDLGVKQNEAGFLADASVYLTDALAEYPRYADAYYQRGMSFYGLNKIDHAIRDLDAATQLKVKSIHAYIALINIYRQQKEFGKALVITERILIQLPDSSIGAYNSQGTIYEETNDFIKALNSYRKAERLAFGKMPVFAEQLEERIARVLIKMKLESRF